MRHLKATPLLFILTISSCLQQGPNTKLSDNDLVVDTSLLSPDKKYIVYEYYYDNGAMGESDGQYAIVKTADTLGIINKYTFDRLNKPPYAWYTPDKWLNDTTLQVKIDIRPFYREDIPIDTSSFKVGDINIKVIPDDKKDGITATIEHYAVSPDGKSLLVAYRYPAVSELNVSVINLTDKLPAYGNILKNFIFEDEVLFGRWTDKKEIIININDGIPENDFQDFLSNVKGYRVKIVKQKYVSKYSGIVAGWYNKELHPNDSVTVKYLNENQNKTKGVIVDISSIGDSYYTKLSNYYYEFVVNGKVYKSYFRADEEQCSLKKGDSIAVNYNRLQPIIHQISGKNYSR